MDHLVEAKKCAGGGYDETAIAHALIAIAELLERIDDALRNTVGGRS